jgi:hypothetical protein
MIKNIKHFVLGTILSILVFFSICFLHILSQLNPFIDHNLGRLEIGFPIPFYEQYCSGDGLLFGWENGLGFLFDIFIIWAIVCGAYLYAKRKKASFS